MYAQNERNISIKRMYEQGISVNIIATQYGISSSSVTNIAKAMGANTARAKVIETYSDEICKMYLEGLSANMIAKQFNYQFSEASVRSLLRRKNVPIRKQGVLAKCNHLCFHNIDSPTSAYLLGLFTADGNVMPKSESWPMSLCVQSRYLTILLDTAACQEKANFCRAFPIYAMNCSHIIFVDSLMVMVLPLSIQADI